MKIKFPFALFGVKISEPLGPVKLSLLNLHFCAIPVSGCLTVAV